MEETLFDMMNSGIARALSYLPEGQGVKALRAAMGKSLGLEKPISQLALGHQLGYGLNVAKRNIERVEDGSRGLSGPAALLAANYARASIPALQPHIVLPEWVVCDFADPDNDAGHIIVERLWWPRMILAAVPHEYDNKFAEATIGRIHDFDIQILHSDVVSPDLINLQGAVAKLIEAGFQLLKTEISEDARFPEQK